MPYIDDDEYEDLKRKNRNSSNDTDDFIMSTIIGAATGSSLIGGLLGGSFLGGVLGDTIEGTDDSFF